MDALRLLTRLRETLARRFMRRIFSENAISGKNDLISFALASANSAKPRGSEQLHFGKQRGQAVNSNLKRGETFIP